MTWLDWIRECSWSISPTGQKSGPDAGVMNRREREAAPMMAAPAQTASLLHVSLATREALGMEEKQTIIRLHVYNRLP